MFKHWLRASLLIGAILACLALQADRPAMAQAATVPIHAIQGGGPTSPLVGRRVSARGIVTARKRNGFFIQAPDSEADSDPNTSEAIFVFTSGAPPASAAVGNEVSVTGTVSEFRPASDPNGPTLTELTDAAVALISVGRPLPAPATIAPSDASPTGQPEQLEKFECMRVEVKSLAVVAPTDGIINEAEATSRSNGVFFGVIEGLPRPFREPGIEIFDPLPPGSPCCIPRFDSNPERLRVDSDGQEGAAPLDLKTGDIVFDLVGVLDYEARAYTLLPDPAARPSILTGAIDIAAPAPGPDQIAIASLNLQRFFDATDDPLIQEPVLTRDAFEARLKKASLTIREVLRLPDVLAVQEVENLAALQAIADAVNRDHGAEPIYRAYLIEGNDPSGIDVGFLVKIARVNVLELRQEGKDETFMNPNTGRAELLNDRPPLLLRAQVGDFGFVVIVSHLRSLSGINDPADGGRVRAKRRAQAEYLARLIQSLQSAGQHVIAVGDYNAFEFNDGYVDVMGTIKGAPAPANQVALASQDLVDPDLINLTELISPEQRYSFVFNGSAQALDHALITRGLLDRLAGIYYSRSNADMPESLRGETGRAERLSDHDSAIAHFWLAPRSEPRIFGASIVGKNLYVTGAGFQAGAIVEINGQPQRTRNDAADPAIRLIAKKGGKRIAPGSTATITVLNPDGARSAPFRFTRPTGV